MLDIKLIRENPDVARKDVEKRQDEEKMKLLEEIITWDVEWRSLSEQLNADRPPVILDNAIRMLPGEGKLGNQLVFISVGSERRQIRSRREDAPGQSFNGGFFYPADLSLGESDLVPLPFGSHRQGLDSFGLEYGQICSKRPMPDDLDGVDESYRKRIRRVIHPNGIGTLRSPHRGVIH